jgi:hypothetical protein
LSTLLFSIFSTCNFSFFKTFFPANFYSNKSTFYGPDYFPINTTAEFSKFKAYKSASNYPKPAAFNNSFSSTIIYSIFESLISTILSAYCKPFDSTQYISLSSAYLQSIKSTSKLSITTAFYSAIESTHNQTIKATTFNTIKATHNHSHRFSDKATNKKPQLGSVEATIL